MWDPSLLSCRPTCSAKGARFLVQMQMQMQWLLAKPSFSCFASVAILDGTSRPPALHRLAMHSIMQFFIAWSTLRQSLSQESTPHVLQTF